jgi:hypothetical protein
MSKSPCPEMNGFCNFAVFVDEKSKVPERVKRDQHVFDLVLFLHPKKCLTCGGEKFALLLVLDLWGTSLNGPTLATPRLPPGDRRHLLPGHTGRRWANFSEIEPALCGDIWLRMVGVKVEMWSDSGKKQARVSIVLKSQVALVNRAYTLLDNLGV